MEIKENRTKPLTLKEKGRKAAKIKKNTVTSFEDIKYLRNSQKFKEKQSRTMEIYESQGKKCGHECQAMRSSPKLLDIS